jgi:hypothetical protein
MSPDCNQTVDNFCLEKPLVRVHRHCGLNFQSAASFGLPPQLILSPTRQ